MRMQSDRFAREIVRFLMLFLAARSRRLMRRAFGTRGNVIDVPFSIWIRRIAIPERPSCQLCRADARCADVVHVLVVLNARCAGRGTGARGAGSPLWVAESCAGRGSRSRPVMQGVIVCWA